MNDKHFSRLWFLNAPNPANELLRVSMGGKAFHHLYRRPHSDFLAHHADALHAVHKAAPQTALRLIPGEENRGFRPPEVVFQMMENTPGVGHTAGRKNDSRAFGAIESLRLRRRLTNAKLRHLRKFSFPVQKLNCFFVEVLAVFHKNPGSRDGQRAVQNDWHIIDTSRFPEFVKIIQECLRPSDGEGRNNQISASVHRIVDDFCQYTLFVIFLMEPIAVSRLDNQKIRAADNAWILDDWLIWLPEVAGKNELRRFSILRRENLDDCGADNVPGVVVDHADMVAEGKFLFIGNRPELLKRPHGVLHRIERVHRLRTAARAFPIPHFCVGDLYMSRIWKHNLRKVAGRFCRVDRAFESRPAQLRNETAVVNVGVSQEHRVQFGGRKQKIFLIQFLDSL